MQDICRAPDGREIKFIAYAEDLPDDPHQLHLLISRVCRAVSAASQGGMKHLDLKLMRFTEEQVGNESVPLEKPILHIRLIAIEEYPCSLVSYTTSAFPA